MTESTTPAPRPRPIFLSYARDDAPTAKRICDALRAVGVEVWYDMNELRGGDAWDAKIRHQIRTCGLFLPIISATTQGRHEGYFRREWKMAVERMNDIATGIAFLVPIATEPSLESEALVPDEFRRVQWTFLPNGEPTPEFTALVRQLWENPRAAPATESAARPPAPASRPAPAAAPRKKSYAAMIAAGVVVGAGVMVAVLHQPAATPAMPVVPVVPVAAPAVSDKSVAVLPFTNMSSEKDTAYFADGIQEDVLTNLALVKQLRVVSRTSVMQYRDTTKAIPVIGRELGVAYILEGSVQRSGQKVRVTGQLIKAGTDEHVWAQSFDGDLTDAFAIQSKLATEIAGALQTKISPEERALINAWPTDNAAAYDLFLKARKLDNDAPPDADSLNNRVTLLGAAVQLDPKFAAAWAELADVHALMAFNFIDGAESRRQSAKDTMAKALALNPDSPAVIQCLGTYYYYLDRDYDKALQQYEKLRSLQPNSSAIPFSIGLIQRRQGRWREGLANLKRAAEMEPHTANYWIQYSDTAADMQHWAEAIAACEHVNALIPGLLQNGFSRATYRYYVDGDKAAVRSFIDQFPSADKNSPAGILVQINLRMTIGDVAEAFALYARLGDRAAAGVRPADLAVTPAFLKMAQGDRAGAAAILKAYPEQIRNDLREQPANAALWLELGAMEMALGHRDEARAAIDKSIELLPSSRDALAGPQAEVMRATWEAYLGSKEKAIDEVTRLLRVPNGILVNDLICSPQWNPLHGMPRFEALIKDPKNREPIE